MPEVAGSVAGEEERLRGFSCKIHKFSNPIFYFKMDMWQFLIGPCKRVSIFRCNGYHPLYSVHFESRSFNEIFKVNKLSFESFGRPVLGRP